MDVPSKSDPRWKTLVQGTAKLEFKVLATKMLLTRVRLMGARRDEKSVTEAIDAAFDFFTRNKEAARDDLPLLFR
jgi:hypothetical protein